MKGVKRVVLKVKSDDCLHRLQRLPKEMLPYRYECLDCKIRLKLASGIVLR